MSTIGDALSRKNRQNPQFDYLWRVELPSLGNITADQLIASQNSIESSRTVSNSTNQRNGGFMGEVDTGGSSSSSSGGFMSSVGTGSSLSSQLSSFLTGEEAFEISHRVYSIDTTYKTFDVDKSPNGFSFTYHASHSDIGAISMTVDEMEDGKTLQYFNKWQGMISADGYSMNMPAYYKRDIVFFRLGSSKLDIHYSIYKGFFPNEISPMSNSYDSSGIAQFNVSLTGDSVQHVFIPEAELFNMVTEQEKDILSNQFEQNKFRPGSFDMHRASGIIDRAIDAFGF